MKQTTTKMTRILILTLGVLWACCCGAMSSKQRGSEFGVARALQPSLTWVEPGFLSLSFNCPSEYPYLSNDEMLSIAPILIRPDGKRLSFSPVVYLQPSSKRFLDRRLQFKPNPLLSHAHFLVTSHQDSSDTFVYQDTLAAGTAQGGLVEIRYYFTDCCRNHYLISDTLRVPDTENAIRRLLPMPVLVNRIPLSTSSVAFTAPRAEPVKLREQVVRVPLHYRVGKSAVDETFRNNALHLARLDSACRPLLSGSADYEIRSIRVVGYASPEDTYGYNLHLSHLRAESFASYLSNRYKIPRSSMEVKGMGEDWAGLRKLILADSLFTQTNEVVQIIDNYDIFDGREAKLMALQSGFPYRYILEKHFPKLRRMELEMEYRVRAFTPEEALRKVSTRPQDLDAYEIYQAARLMSPDSLSVSDDGRLNYGEVLDLAVSFFPDDVTTRINAASVALLRYDLKLAYQHLHNLMDVPEAWNNIGIYFWMCGDLHQAREYFKKALPYSSEAGKNLDKLKSWEEKRP